MTRFIAAAMSLLLIAQGVSLLMPHEKAGACANVESRPITVNYVDPSGTIKPRVENAGVCVDNK